MTANTPNTNLRNTEAREGCDRCYCGCKYWERDRCIDCGTTIAECLRDPAWVAENRTADGDAPNPDVSRRYDAQVGGGVVRTYRNGMVDAVDGIGFSISPGFTSVAALRSWWAEWVVPMTPRGQ